MNNSSSVPENLTTELEKQTWRAVMAARGNSVVLFGEVEQQIYNAIMAAGGCGGGGGEGSVIQGVSAQTLPPGSEAFVKNIGTQLAPFYEFGIPSGENGAPGQDGSPGKDGQDAVAAITPRGDFSPDASPSYARNDYVTGKDGNAYVCKIDNPDNVAPVDGSNNDPYWQLLVLRGAPGQSATVAVGAVSTLEPEATATVVNTGTAQDVKLDFGIPRGTPGPAGFDGASIDWSTPNSLVITSTQATAFTTTYTMQPAEHDGVVIVNVAATISSNTNLIGQAVLAVFINNVEVYAVGMRSGDNVVCLPIKRGDIININVNNSVTNDNSLKINTYPRINTPYSAEIDYENAIAQQPVINNLDVLTKSWLLTATNSGLLNIKWDFNSDTETNTYFSVEINGKIVAALPNCSGLSTIFSFYVTKGQEINIYNNRHAELEPYVVIFPYK